jgi:SAM-dependent methyltransferase
MISKSTRYQDYVIKDGALVGEFEQMYQDCSDPWEQTVREKFSSEKAVALNLIQRLGVKSVLEIGCGLGCFTGRIAALGVQATGIDVSPTAVARAQERNPECRFFTADILDLDLFRDRKPDLIVMAEVTWYVLDKLDRFLAFLKTEIPDTWLIHLLTTYPSGVQKYGREKFTDLPGIMAYFNMNYLESGIVTPKGDGCSRTWFAGRFGDGQSVSEG